MLLGGRTAATQEPGHAIMAIKESCSFHALAEQSSTAPKRHQEKMRKQLGMYTLEYPNPSTDLDFTKSDCTRFGCDQKLDGRALGAFGVARSPILEVLTVSVLPMGVSTTSSSWTELDWVTTGLDLLSWSHWKPVDVEFVLSSWAADHDIEAIPQERPIAPDAG